MQIVKRFSPERQAQVKAYLNAHLLPLATAEQARCAKGRLNLWLQAEPDYRSKKYLPAHTDSRVWQFCQQIYPAAALAQIYFARGGIGIDWHRDAAYAKPKAFICNLGEVCLQTKSPDGHLVSLDLTGGEVVEFNAKWLHRAIPKADDRIGIGIWSDAIDIGNPVNWLHDQA